MNKWILCAFILVISQSVAHRPVRAAEPTLEWRGLADGGARALDYGTAVTVDPSSGDLIVAGEIEDGVAGSDIWIRRLDRTSGGEVWGTTWGVPEGNDMACTGVVPDGRGDFLVGCYIRGCPT
jgi:hypothetical protein